MTKSVIRFVREILISTHILTKRMTGIIPCRFSFPDISTHILTKRMTVLQRTEKFKLSFQLTSSRRGWRRCFIIIWCYEQKLFQLTSSRRGWPERPDLRHRTEPFQLTSSRRGWHKKTVFLCYKFFISTHILTKRMTFCGTDCRKCDNISTHILTKRMTIKIQEKV